MRNIHYTIMACYFLLLLGGCHIDVDLDNDETSCIEGSKRMVSERRNIEGFDQINVHDDVEVYITQGNRYEIKVSAESNLIKRVETNISGQTLDIDLRGCIKEHRTISVYVTTPTLRAIIASGSAHIIGEGQIKTNQLDVSLFGSGDIDLGVEARNLKVRHTGSGSILLNGVTDFQDVILKGTGDYDGIDLYSSTSHVLTKGSGNTYIYVRKQLYATITGSGNIYYKGFPRSIKTDITGSGNLIKQ